MLAHWNKRVIALNVGTGETIWETEPFPSVLSYLAADGDIVIGLSSNVAGIVYALDAAVGSLVWEYEIGGNLAERPTIAGGVVYLWSINHSIYALDAKMGTLLWRYERMGQSERCP